MPTPLTRLYEMQHRLDDAIQLDTDAPIQETYIARLVRSLMPARKRITIGAHAHMTPSEIVGSLTVTFRPQHVQQASTHLRDIGLPASANSLEVMVKDFNVRATKLAKRKWKESDLGGKPFDLIKDAEAVLDHVWLAFCERCPPDDSRRFKSGASTASQGPTQGELVKEAMRVTGAKKSWAKTFYRVRQDAGVDRNQPGQHNKRFTRDEIAKLCTRLREMGRIEHLRIAEAWEAKWLK